MALIVLLRTASDEVTGSWGGFEALIRPALGAVDQKPGKEGRGGRCSVGKLGDRVLGDASGLSLLKRGSGEWSRLAERLAFSGAVGTPQGGPSDRGEVVVSDDDDDSGGDGGDGVGKCPVKHWLWSKDGGVVGWVGARSVEFERPRS